MVLVGPNGNCPDCQHPLTQVTFSCGDEKGHCLMCHYGLQCVGCDKVWEEERRLKHNPRAVNVSRQQ